MEETALFPTLVEIILLYFLRGMYETVYAIFWERLAERIFKDNFYSDFPPYILTLELLLKM